jgi:hypothetical protein
MAEAARQKPALSVWPVFSPSIAGSRHSSVLRLCWRMPLKVNSFSAYQA